MLARIRKQLEERDDKGFTLVELLVVIIIIGILAAIAIPLYLNQQAKAKDSALKSDLKNAQIEVASSLVDDNTGGSIPGGAALSKSPDVTISDPVIDVAGGTFTVCGVVVGGDVGSYCIDQDGTLS
ncbi:prepilin-type N-terminal cleavage/methylation domain-containing protein [Demequina sp.]|uniref:prepilin-type N-terminal cleavage/methylation domain-containing protein n=1 Tax=Demequina sp. TaxID=2050685 RepID=UPI0025E00229|nr:prepilin-type N-terminal cleavage/methylation domain-containing protein [Demequina sp.]